VLDYRLYMGTGIVIKHGNIYQTVLFVTYQKKLNLGAIEMMGYIYKIEKKEDPLSAELIIISVTVSREIYKKAMLLHIGSCEIRQDEPDDQTSCGVENTWNV